MKLLIFKNKKLYYCFMIILLFIGLSLILISTFKEPSNIVFNLNNNTPIIKDDLNNDGKKDSIIINENSNDILMEVNLNTSENYNLKSLDSGISLGRTTNYWKPRVTTFDVSRDNFKEIFIQASLNDKSIQHVFSWDGSNFNDILCTENNLLGIVNSTNNKTPIIISANIVDDKIDFRNFIFTNNKLREFKSKYDSTYIGINSIIYFINLIENFPNNNLTIPEYFHHSLSGSDIETLYKLSSQRYSLYFQDGYFTDTSWNSKGEVTKVNWILSFRCLNKTETKNLTFNLILTKTEDEYYKYKITSINYY